MVICLERGADLHIDWCHCDSLSLASVKSRLVLPFWYRLTWVVPEKWPLNGCVCVASHPILPTWHLVSQNWPKRCAARTYYVRRKCDLLVLLNLLSLMLVKKVCDWNEHCALGVCVNRSVIAHIWMSVYMCCVFTNLWIRIVFQISFLPSLTSGCQFC